MFLLISLLLVLSSCSNWTNSQDSEPVGPQIWSGKEVPEGKWPFMAEIRLNDSKTGHLCGASVLNDDTVITAAHCLLHKNNTHKKVYLYLGQTKTWDPVDKDSVYNVSKFILNPLYGNGSGGQDIALIKLSRTIDFKSAKGRICKVCLPSPDTKPDGSKCVAIGWGKVEPDKERNGVLLQVDLPIVPCKGEHPRVICAGFYDKPDGICHGDSGGPLVCPPKDNPNTYLLFGLSAILFDKCGKAPGGFTEVAQFLKWIQENAEN